MPTIGAIQSALPRAADAGRWAATTLYSSGDIVYFIHAEYQSRMAMSDRTPDLWLEFEAWAEDASSSADDDAFNMHIRLGDGTLYALNVWTFKALERFHHQDATNGDNLNGRYLIPPDLLIERLDRHLVEQVVFEMIRKKELKSDWLVKDV
jgi:hypothetical protein